MLLTCQVTSRDHMLKGYVNVWLKAPYSKSPPSIVW